MLSEDKNALITRVERGHPMHDVISGYWIPAGLSRDIAGSDSDPRQIMLLGRKYVMFRDTAGTAVVMDDACAHRGASLSLGRVEDGGIRCIYHGWKFDAEGRLTDAPNVASLSTIKHICQPHYPVREAAGFVWAYLGDPARQPLFPAFPFFDVPQEQLTIERVVVNCNYVQVIEGVIDPAHHGVLHADLHAKALTVDGKPVLGQVNNQLIADKAPRVEVKDTDWGFRYAALRDVPSDDGATIVQARVTAFSMPFCSMVAGRFAALFAVPVHSGQTIHHHIFADYEGSAESKARMDALVAAHRFSTAMAQRGHPADGYVTGTDPVAQDRDAMREGRLFGGIDNVILEDVAVTESMGPISDRSIEHLVPSDAAIVRMRRLLLENVRRHQAGEKLIGIDRDEHPVGAEGMVTAERPWPMLVQGVIIPTILPHISYNQSYGENDDHVTGRDHAEILGHVSAGETDKLAAFFAEDAHFEDVALGHASDGRDHIAGVLKSFFDVMPCRFEVENIVEDGQQFAAQWIVSGNHTAQIMKFPAPTGKPFRYRGVSVGLIEDGVIKRKADYWNFSTLMEQIGG